MNPLMPVLTERAVATRFSMLRKIAACRCWEFSLALNQPSLVMFTRKSARFTVRRCLLGAEHLGADIRINIFKTDRRHKMPVAVGAGQRRRMTYLRALTGSVLGCISSCGIRSGKHRQMLLVPRHQRIGSSMCGGPKCTANLIEPRNRILERNELAVRHQMHLVIMLGVLASL